MAKKSTTPAKTAAPVAVAEVKIDPRVKSLMDATGLSLELATTALARLDAQTPAKKSAGRTPQPGLIELTAETAAAKIAKRDWVGSVKITDDQTAYILETNGGPGIYSVAIFDHKANGVVDVRPGHVDRVKSPRHLPRCLRLLGSWLGEQPGFNNGPKAKGDEVTQAAVEDDEDDEAEAPATKTPAKKAAKKSNRK